MIIVSQDKNIIINFDNIANINMEKCYNESLKEEDFTYDILVYIVSSGLTRIAKYATEERAKEILEGIIESYLTSIDYKYNQTLLIGDLGEYREGLVYRMPKE